MKIENGPPQRFAFFARVGAIPYLFFALIIFLLWASYFEIDQTVRVQGQLVSESKTQIIQSADGGVIEKIFVREGDAVKAGKVVARLEQTRASAEYEETRTKAVALEIAIARVKAEANGSNPDFSKFPPQYKHVVNYQRELYQTRLHNLKTELGYIYEGTDLALKEHQMNERLFASGDISATDLMRSQRQLLEIKAKKDAVLGKYRLEAGAELVRLSDELSAQLHRTQGRESLVIHTELFAPHDGIVKSLKINSAGGVLRPGDEIMQISPTKDNLILEVRVPPSEIGMIQTGQPVSVKIDTYDYSVYGALDGKILDISPDSINEPSAQANGVPQNFYRVKIKVIQDASNERQKNIVLKPGMTAAADIQVGQRSILIYLMKPIVKTLNVAGSER